MCDPSMTKQQCSNPLQHWKARAAFLRFASELGKCRVTYFCRSLATRTDVKVRTHRITIASEQFLRKMLATHR